MNPWLAWGLPIILWLQSLGAGLEGPMEFLSFLGREEFFLLILPALLWCFDAGLGVRVALILLTSAVLNNIVKFAFGWPRPYWVSEQVAGMSSEPDFGLPSGHAQHALAVWGRLAAALRRAWAYTGAGALIFFISISRLYLGVHFPTDVLGGWAIGGLLLVAFLVFEKPVRNRLAAQTVASQIVVALAASLLLIGLTVVVTAASEDRPIPQAWTAAASEVGPIEPRPLESVVASSGALFGIAGGAALLFREGRFDASSGGLGRRAGRYLLGVVGVIVIFYGLRAVFPGGEDPVALALRYVRYALVGAWVAYLGPRAFQRVGLA